MPTGHAAPSGVQNLLLEDLTVNQNHFTEAEWRDTNKLVQRVHLIQTFVVLFKEPGAPPPPHRS